MDIQDKRRNRQRMAKVYKEKRDRGMVLYQRDTHGYNVVTPTTNFEEVIIVQLILLKESLILTSIYRSPYSTIENNNSLNTLMNSISKFGLQSIMIGDFNFNKI